MMNNLSDDAQDALLLFPYDHECNPTRLLEMIARGEQILYRHFMGTRTEKHTFESASGVLFIVPHNDSVLIMDLAQLVLNALHERGYGMIQSKGDEVYFGIGAPELFPNEIPYLAGIEYI